MNLDDSASRGYDYVYNVYQVSSSISIRPTIRPMLTMRTRYALKALTVLAATGSSKPVLIGELAEREAIPRKFLEAILRELKQHGLLTAQRGRGGGYALRLKPEEITLASVIRALDGPIAPVPCLSRTAYRKCDECKDERTCGVKLVLKDLYDATAQVLEGTTLADLARRTQQAEGQTSHTFAYSI
ncbi:MAG TPA: Rrf2 family transcriptional regulator [Polyangiaceae bacterium]